MPDPCRRGIPLEHLVGVRGRRVVGLGGRLASFSELEQRLGGRWARTRDLVRPWPSVTGGLRRTTRFDRVDVPTIQDARSSTAVTERERALGLNILRLSQPARICGTRWQSRTGSFLLTLDARRSDGTQ
jgi:hypothetical protein